MRQVTRLGLFAFSGVFIYGAVLLFHNHMLLGMIATALIGYAAIDLLQSFED